MSPAWRLAAPRLALLCGLWLPLGCLAFMGGFLGWVFVNKFKSHPPYPQKDPRLLEAMGIHHLECQEISGAAITTGGRS